MTAEISPDLGTTNYAYSAGLVTSMTDALGNETDYSYNGSREQTEACYPQLKIVLAEKRRIDPDEKLVNAWYLHHRSLLGRTSCEVRWNN